jgi:hypothetical protein
MAASGEPAEESSMSFARMEIASMKELSVVSGWCARKAGQEGTEQIEHEEAGARKS